MAECWRNTVGRLGQCKIRQQQACAAAELRVDDRRLTASWPLTAATTATRIHCCCCCCWHMEAEAGRSLLGWPLTSADKWKTEASMHQAFSPSSQVIRVHSVTGTSRKDWPIARSLARTADSFVTLHFAVSDCPSVYPAVAKWIQSVRRAKLRTRIYNIDARLACNVRLTAACRQIMMSVNNDLQHCTASQ